MFEINRRNRAAATSVPGASPTPSEPGQLQDMSTVAVAKRSSRRKQKSKLSDDFGSASSGPSHLQSNGDVIFQRLLAFFTMHQNVNQGERQHAVDGDHSKSETASKCGSKGEDFPAPSTTLNKCKTNITSHNNKHWSKTQRNINASKFADDKAGSVAEEPIVHLKPKQTPLTEFDVVDIVRQLRDILLKNGPSQEDDLLEALTTSQAQIIINVYGTITAFLDRRPGFEVIYESLYTFVYYKHTDDEDDVLDEGAAVLRARCSNESGFQYSVAGGDGRRRTRIISSASPSYASAMDGGGDKKEKCRMRHEWSQVRWLPPYNSQALQAVEPTRETEVQTEGGYTAIQSTLHRRDLQSSEFKEKLNTTAESQACEEHQLREKIELKTLSSPAPPRGAVKANNCSSKNEQRRTKTYGRPKRNSPPPHPHPTPSLRRRSPLRRPKADENIRAFPFAPRQSQVSMQRWRATSPCPKAKSKPRVLPLEPTPRLVRPHRRRAPSPRPKPERKPRARATGPMARPAPRQRRRPPHKPKVQENSRALPLEPMARRTPTKRRRPPPQPKVEEKSRARPLEPMTRPANPQRRRPPPQPKVEEKSRALPLERVTRPAPQRFRRASPLSKVEEKSHALPFEPMPQRAPPQRPRSSPHRKVEGKSRAFPLEPMDRPAPPQRRGASPQPKVKEPQVEEPKVEEKSRARPLEPMTRPAAPQRRRTSPQSKVEEKSRALSSEPMARPALLQRWRASPQPKAEQKPRALPFEPIPRPALPQRRRTSPQPKWEEKSRAVPLEPMPRPAPPQRRRGSPQPKVEEKSRALPLAPMPRPVPPQRTGASPQPKEVEEKSRALPLELMAGLAPTKSRRAPPFPRPKAEENPRPFSDVRTPRPTPPIDEKFRRPAKQPAVSVYHEVHRHRKQVAASCSDVECTPSSHVPSPVKSTAEKQMSKLVEMVKKNKPEYTEQEIRLRLGDLRRSRGGFSRMTLKAIVALMQDRLETEEKQRRHGEDGVSSKEKAGNVFFLRAA